MVSTVVDSPIFDRDENDQPILDFQNPVPSETPETFNRRRMEAASIIAGDDNSEDFVNAYKGLIAGPETTGFELRAEATANAYQRVTNSNIEALQGLLISAPEQANSAIQAFKERENEIAEEASAPEAPYKVLMQQIGDPTKLSEQDIEELAVRAMLADQIEEIVSSMTGAELAGDIALELIPFKFLTDIVQVTGEFNVFETEDAIRSIIGNFRALTPKQKLIQFPIIKEDLLDQVPKFRAAAILGAMLDPSAEEDVAFEFGPLAIIDAAAMFAGLLQIANKARVAFNFPKIASKVGNPKIGARVSTTVLADKTGEVADAVGIDRLTALNSSLPFKTSEEGLQGGTFLDAAADNTLSGAAQNDLINFTEQLNQALTAIDARTSFIAEGILSDIDRPAAINRIDNLFVNHVEGIRNGPKIVQVTDVKGGALKFIPVDDADGVGLVVRRPGSKTNLGAIEADVKKGVATIFNVSLAPELQGQGLGIQLYKRFIAKQVRLGNRVVSDNSVSESAIRVWESLERQGFKIKRNPNFEDTPGGIGGGFQRKTIDDKPLFELEKVPESFDLRQFDEGISEVQDVERLVSTRGVKFNFVVRDSEGVEEIGTFERTFDLNDIGHYENIAEPGALANFLGSQKARAFGTDLAPEVETALRLDFIEAAAQNQLAKLMVEAVKPIAKLRPGRKDRVRQVSDVLLYGDNPGGSGKGIVFTPSELRSGVNGIRLDDDQIVTYYNVRNLFDGIGQLRNNAKVREFVARNVKTVFHGGKPLNFGSVAEEVSSAQRILNNQPTANQVYDLVNNTPINIRDIDLEDLYANGKRLIQLEDSTILNKGRWSLVITDVDSIKALPTTVLDLKVGYVPRLNPKAAWFAQAFTTSTINGAKGVTRKVVRAFDNKKEADAFAKTFQAEVTAGNTDLLRSAKIEVLEDKALEAFRAGDSGIGASRGLIYGPRAEKPVPFGLPADELENVRLGAFESLSLYLENTKNFVTRNEWRMGMRRRWENTARKMLFNKNITYDNPGSALENGALRTWRDQINIWSGYLDKSERWWDDLVQKSYEGIVGKFGRSRATEFVHNLKHKDPFTQLKIATFHSLLGAFNPIQLIVQASGSAVALSQNLLRPDKLANFLFRQNALRLVENMEPGSKAFNTAARSFGWKPATLAKYRELWKKTGLFESTLTNADYQAAAAGFAVTASGVRKALNGSLMFFREGELFNRRIAFMTAIDKLGGIEKIAKNENLQRKVLSMVSDFTLALGRGNRAWWQRGPLSVPTQFLQIISKTVEAMLGINGSLAGGVAGIGNRLKMLITQMGLYGAAGIPAGAAIAKGIADMMGITQTELNERPDLVRWVNGGAIDGMFYSYLNVDATISDRLALGNGLGQTMLDFFEDEQPLFDLATGPTGGVAKRIYNKAGAMSSYWARYIDPQEMAIVVREDEILETVKFLLEDTVELVTSGLSSANQVQRFMQMQDFNRLLDRRQGVITERDFNLRTEIAVLMGAQTLDQQDKFTLQDMNRSGEDYIRGRVDQLMYGHDRLLIEIESARQDDKLLTPGQKRRHDTAYNVVMGSVENANTRTIIHKRFRERLAARGKGKSQLDIQQDKFYRNFIDDLAGDIIDLNTKMTQTR